MPKNMTELSLASKAKKPHGAEPQTGWLAGLNRPFTATISIGFAVLLVYLLIIRLLAPGFTRQRYALLTHLLLLLAAATICFAIADVLCLLALRRHLQKDQMSLIRLYSDPAVLRQIFLEGSEANSSEGAHLGAGLVHAALERCVRLGRRSSGIFLSALSQGTARTRFGEDFFSFAIPSAPLLGLLGTVLGLRATFTNTSLLENGVMHLPEVMPYLGIALVTTMLGLTVAVTAMAFRYLLGSTLARDCRELLGPVVDTVRGTLEMLGIEKEDVSGEHSRREALPPWSQTFARQRIHSVLLALLVTALVLVFICYPGGIFDELLQPSPAMFPSPQETQVVSLDRERERPERKFEFEISLKELLGNYSQTVILEEKEDLIAAFVQYMRPPKPFEDDLGTSERARTYKELRIPIAGIIDIVVPPDRRYQLDHAYPRCIARVDLLELATNQILRAQVTYIFLDGRGDHQILATEFETFIEELRMSGQPLSSGQLLSPEYLRLLLPEITISQIDERANDAWSATPTEAEHITWWLAFESGRKLEQAKSALGNPGIQGRNGDFLVLTWRVEDDTAELISADALAPREATALIEKQEEIYRDGNTDQASG